MKSLFIFKFKVLFDPHIPLCSLLKLFNVVIGLTRRQNTFFSWVSTRNGREKLTIVIFNSFSCSQVMYTSGLLPCFPHLINSSFLDLSFQTQRPKGGMFTWKVHTASFESGISRLTTKREQPRHRAVIFTGRKITFDTPRNPLNILSFFITQISQKAFTPLCSFLFVVC